MLRVNVSIASISAERFWDTRKPIPPIQINTNINIVGMDKKPDGSLDVPFVLSIGYNPSIGQINLKGTAYVSGDQNEIDKILSDFEKKKAPAQIIIQTVSNVSLIEAVLIARTLNIPPPIPLPQIPEAGKQPQMGKIEGRDYSQ
jgi:hypothetical protein